MKIMEDREERKKIVNAVPVSFKNLSLIMEQRDIFYKQV